MCLHPQLSAALDERKCMIGLGAVRDCVASGKGLGTSHDALRLSGYRYTTP